MDIESSRAIDTRPIIRPLEVIECFKYGCVWLIIAMVFAVTAGIYGDTHPENYQGHIASFIVCGVASLIVCICRSCADEFVP